MAAWCWLTHRRHWRKSVWCDKCQCWLSDRSDRP